MASPLGSEEVPIANNLPSPPASTAASSHYASPLPQPRRNPLKPGGAKESELISYLDHSINGIQKRVDNRVTNWKSRPVEGQKAGYSAFWEAAKDLDGLVDVVWVSGSPNLQIPYLLNLAVLIAEFLPLFQINTRSARAMFSLLSKMDDAFSSLLRGRDMTTDEPLSGFANGRIVSTTDKVRLKGLVDRTRLTVVRVMSMESVTGDEGGFGDAMNTDMDIQGTGSGNRDTVVFEGFEDNEDDDDDDEWEERNIARVYEKTISELGDVLGGSPIGIITED